MSITSVNCTPIKPQVSFASAEGVDEAQKILQLSRQLNDSFQKENKDDDENITVKHPLQTTLSLAGAGLAMFALGKGVGKAIIGASKKTPENVKTGLVKGLKTASDWTSKQADKLPKNEKLTAVFDKSVGKVANGLKGAVSNAIEKNGAEKVFTTATGALAAATLLPKVAKADGNSDGIADIAQNGINAYQSAFKTAEIFSDMINALV